MYPGAACGRHIVYLANLFPQLKFHLFDTQKFDRGLKKCPNVKIFYEYFTNELAEKYAKKNTILISDIRDLSIKERLGNSSNSVVHNDMIMQKEWYELMKPLTAFLKFRLSWEKGKTEYLAGKIYFQVWQGRHSTETRIVPNGKTKKYNNTKYEEQLHYFNRITRRKKYEHDLDKKVYCQCYDCYSESEILRKYVEVFILEKDKKSINTPKSDSSDSDFYSEDEDDERINQEIELMRNEIDQQLGRPLF